MLLSKLLYQSIYSLLTKNTDSQQAYSRLCIKWLPTHDIWDKQMLNNWEPSILAVINRPSCLWSVVNSPHLGSPSFNLAYPVLKIVGYAFWTNVVSHPRTVFYSSSYIFICGYVREPFHSQLYVVTLFLTFGKDLNNFSF